MQHIIDNTPHFFGNPEMVKRTKAKFSKDDEKRQDFDVMLSSSKYIDRRIGDFLPLSIFAIIKHYVFNELLLLLFFQKSFQQCFGLPFQRIPSLTIRELSQYNNAYHIWDGYRVYSKISLSNLLSRLNKFFLKIIKFC